MHRVPGARAPRHPPSHAGHRTGALRRDDPRALAPWLRAQGFRKRRNAFRREDDRGWQIVDFQASSFGSRDNTQFTVNLRFGVAPISEWIHTERIGHLLPGGEDTWWDVVDTTDTAALGEQMRALVERLALPWLEMRQDLDAVLRLATERPEEFPHWALGRFAMLLARAGRTAEASAVERIAAPFERRS